MDAIHAMALRQSQKQKMILTADLKESLGVLQMSIPELLCKAEKAAAENPVIELTVEDAFWTASLDSRKPIKRSNGETFDSFLFLSETKTFVQQLLQQLGEMKVPKHLRPICRYLISSLDERGYLSVDVPEVAHDLGMNVQTVECALRVIQRMEPAGVGARNLSECLSLQLHKTEDHQKALFDIVACYLPLLADNKINDIAKALHISQAEAIRMCQTIRELNPIPSNGFYLGHPVEPAIPDAVIFCDENGHLLMEATTSRNLHLSINPEYQRLAMQTDDPETAAYLKEKIKQASLLMRETAYRQKTIFGVLEKILVLQRDYFLQDKHLLKPMTLTEIAQSLSLHESTVSRAVQGKYILCRYGIVAIRSLFSGKINHINEEETISPLVVKQTISALIAKEDKHRPLSDQVLCDYLCAQGFSIARRTIAKYRDELFILPAAKRKR